MFRLFRVWALFAAVLPALACGSGQSGGERTQFINILSGGTSGVYYPLAVGLSQLFTRAIPGAKVSVQATNASAQNLLLLEAERGELGFTIGDSLSDAWAGRAEAGFDVPLKKLRTVAGIYRNFVQIVASDNSGIRTLADLKGKRVSVGAPKSGTELNARAIVKAGGLSYDDFSKVEYLPFGESVELIKNRQLDATLQSAALGVASLRDLATSVKIVVVAVPPDVVARVGDAAYQPATIPGGTYQGQDNDVQTASIQNFLVTHDAVPDEVVYLMTKALFEGLDQLAASHVAAKEIRLENAIANLPVPLHPGAERYYREIGLLK